MGRRGEDRSFVEHDDTRKKKGNEKGINAFSFLSMPCFLYLFKAKISAFLPTVLRVPWALSFLTGYQYNSS
jgi:hypothetical protein